MYFLKYMIAADYFTFPKGISIRQQRDVNTGHSTELLIAAILAQIKRVGIIPIKLAS